MQWLTALWEWIWAMEALHLGLYPQIPLYQKGTKIREGIYLIGIADISGIKFDSVMDIAVIFILDQRG